MTPKEKAKELVDKFREFSYVDYEHQESHEDFNLLFNSKQCALICVYEQIKLINDYADRQMLTNWATARGYWEEVKQEIQKL